MLASCLHDHNVIEEMAWVSVDHFYFPAHRVLWQQMMEMKREGSPVDLVLLSERLIARSLIDEAGGAYAVTDLMGFVPSSANAEYYARVMADKYTRRKIIETCQKLSRRATADDETAPEILLQECEAALIELRQNSASVETIRHAREPLMEAVSTLEATYRSRGQTMGIATGTKDIDRMTGGFRPGQLIVPAARPGMGKTALMVQWGLHMSQTVPVMIFSLEMTSQEIMERALSCETPVSLKRMRDGFLEKADWPRITAAAGRLAKAGIYIDDTPGLGIFEFRSRARRAVVKYGAQVLFVDYLQLMKSPSRRADMSRQIEISEVSMALKATAKELKVPVIACAQLNRDAEDRKGPPRLADIRESGQIEQDADMVMFLHRPHKDSEDRGERDIAEIHVAKHRNGPIGKVELRFIGELTKFEDVTEKMYSNNENERQRK